MCKANEYVKQLKDINNNIISDYDKKQLEVYKHDAKQQDILHEIEMVELKGLTLGGLLKGFKLYKQLHDLRVERRKAKNELATLEILKNEYCDKIDLHKLDKKIAEKDDKVNKGMYNKRLDENGDITKSVHSNKIQQLQKIIKKEDFTFTPNARLKRGVKCEIVNEEDKYYYVNFIEELNGGIQKNVKVRKSNIIRM